MPPIKKRTPEEYYKQFPSYIKPKHNTAGILDLFKELARRLKPYKITVAVVPWNKYDREFAFEYWIRDKKIDGNYIFYSEDKLFWDARRPEGCMYLYYGIDKELWPAVNKEIKEVFAERTNGITSIHDALKIYFAKRKNIPIDVEKVIFTVDLTFDKKINELATPTITKINNVIKKIGYVDSYDMNIKNGELNFYCNINFDKIAEFKRAIISIKKIKLPHKIKKINYTMLDN